MRRVLLVGFMGSGKSTVGPLLARELGWTFRDLDEEVEARAGRSIPEIFRDSGEEAFRAEEDLAARELLTRDRLVLASGGGWPCRPGRLEGLPAGTLSIWLRVGAAAAVDRARVQGSVRPLLEGPDPVGRARELLERRSPYYGLADWSVDSEEAPPLELARRLAKRIGRHPEGLLPT